VKVPQFCVPAFPYDGIVPDDDRANQRIGTDPPAPALGKLQRSAQVAPIRACELRVHGID
jgi:hypothetical protein